MWGAIRNAASLVQPGGTFAIGIYNFKGGRRGTITWQKLKRWYCAAPKWQKASWEYTYIAWNLLYLLLVGRNPVTIIREYKTKRGMSWFRDVTDWLGGYPYEAATPGNSSLCGVSSDLSVKQNINLVLVSEFVFGSLRR
jgi:2-polyprenyl-6-hydroxyphenyl methylase/3-demethylubiquinone-9 3-methyltransferase